MLHVVAFCVDTPLNWLRMGKVALFATLLSVCNVWQ
jgi:hypothetical protein